MSAQHLPLFATPMDAIKGLRALARNWQKHATKGGSAPSTTLIVPNATAMPEKEVSHKKDTLNMWVAQCANLTQKWGKKDLQEILQQNGMASRETMLMEWIRMPFVDVQDALKTVLQWGIDPTQYIPNARVTLLGFAAYALRVDAFEMLLRHSAHPQSRLMLEAKHLSDTTANTQMVGATLLHRLAQRFGASSTNVSSDVIRIAEHIARLDPDSVLCRTKQKCAIEDLSPKGSVHTALRDLRLRREAELSKIDLQQSLSVEHGASPLALSRKKI